MRHHARYLSDEIRLAQLRQTHLLDEAERRRWVAACVRGDGSLQPPRRALALRTRLVATIATHARRLGRQDHLPAGGAAAMGSHRAG